MVKSIAAMNRLVRVMLTSNMRIGAVSILFESGVVTIWRVPECRMMAVLCMWKDLKERIVGAWDK